MNMSLIYAEMIVSLFERDLFIAQKKGDSEAINAMIEKSGNVVVIATALLAKNHKQLLALARHN